MTSPVYSSFGYTQHDSAPSTGKYVPVSTTSSPQWVTIPWDLDYSDPENQHSQGGWSFLVGPGIFAVDSDVRIMNQQDDAALHIRLWMAQNINGVDTRVGELYAWEWFVGPNEHGNTHVNGTWKGWLPADVRLRVEIDYWHASAGCNVVGGNVRCLVWRL